MTPQKQSYTKLYSSSKTKLDTPDAALSFENPDLSKLSNEASEKCEGKITMEECQNIIKTFQLGKTPGNDGLPVEFYNVFWSSLGKWWSKALMRLMKREKCQTHKGTYRKNR